MQETQQLIFSASKPLKVDVIAWALMYFVGLRFANPTYVGLG